MVGIPCEVEADALEEKVVAIFRSWDVIFQLNTLKLVTGSIKRISQSLSIFREGRTASMSKETCEK